MMEMIRNPAVRIALVAALVVSLSACGALRTSVEKSELDVQTRASESIFLEPVAPDQRVGFVSVRNTTDKDLDIKQRTIARLQQSGYRITENPDEAQFMLQANVLKVGKTNQDERDSFVEAGFTGAALGNAVSSSSDSTEGIILGAIAGVVVDALVADVLFTMVTDLQVRERPRGNERVTQAQSAETTQGSSTTVTESSNRSTVDWKTYRTRIVSTANQVNLEFEEALPALENGLVRSIAGLFAE